MIPEFVDARHRDLLDTAGEALTFGGLISPTQVIPTKVIGSAHHDLPGPPSFTWGPNWLNAGPPVSTIPCFQNLFVQPPQYEDTPALQGYTWFWNGQAIPIIAMRVRAATAGVYQGVYHEAGDVFDITSNFFSDATQNYQGGGGEYAPGWMISVGFGVPLLTQRTSGIDSVAPQFPWVDPNRRFVM